MPQVAYSGFNPVRHALPSPRSLLQVPFLPSTLLVADVRCLDGQSLRPQGWSVVPVFVDGVVASSLYQLPLFAGTPSAEALDHLANCPRGQWHRFVSTAIEKGHLKHVSGASVTVLLLDAQRFGEFDSPESRPEVPDRLMLPPDRIESYVGPASVSEPLSSVLATDESPSDYLVAAVRTFRSAMKL